MDSIVKGLKKLNRFRTLSRAELRVRGRQQLAKLGERFLRLSQGEMIDESFLTEIKASQIEGSAEATAASIFNRVRNANTSNADSTINNFFPSLLDRDGIVSVMGQQFPSEQLNLIDCAERAIQGRYDLLGFKNLSFGQPIDWHLEPTSRKRTSLQHWSRINFLEPQIAGDK